MCSVQCDGSWLRGVQSAARLMRECEFWCVIRNAAGARRRETRSGLLGLATTASHHEAAQRHEQRSAGRGEDGTKGAGTGE